MLHVPAKKYPAVPAKRHYLWQEANSTHRIDDRQSIIDTDSYRYR